MGSGGIHPVQVLSAGEGVEYQWRIQDFPEGAPTSICPLFPKTIKIDISWAREEVGGRAEGMSATGYPNQVSLPSLPLEHLQQLYSVSAAWIPTAEIPYFCLVITFSERLSLFLHKLLFSSKILK